MSHSVSVGTTLKISASIPATFDAAGYAALTFTTVGEVTNFGDIGREYQISSHNPVATRGTQKKKTTFNEGTFNPQIALDTDDAGQIIMKSARLSTSDHSFLVTTPNGDKYYCQGLVTGFKVGLGDAQGVISASAAIEVNCNSSDVGWVESLAA